MHQPMEFTPLSVYLESGACSGCGQLRCGEAFGIDPRYGLPPEHLGAAGGVS